MSDPESGRCARCHELTVLERMECDVCNGGGLNDRGEVGGCFECQGTGYTDLTPCCGRELIDEADATDDAYERGRAEGWER